jgi:sirohydrochlorin ferrochelatase
MKRKVGIVVVAHGSRRAEGNATLARFVAQLRERLQNECIEPAFMDLGEPTILDAIIRLTAQGCNHIQGYALFLVPGRHLNEDIPRQFESALNDHPGITWELSPPLLEDPAMVEFVAGKLAG